MNCQFCSSDDVDTQCVCGIMLDLGSVPWLNELVNHWYVLNATLTCCAFCTLNMCVTSVTSLTVLMTDDYVGEDLQWQSQLPEVVQASWAGATTAV